MTDTLTVDKVIETYLVLRAKKEKIEEDVKEQVVEVKAKMLKLEAWLQAKADETGVKSFKTDAGTAFLTTSDFASVADWDAFLKFVQDNEAYHLLTKGASKVAVREHIDANKSLPAGINYGSRIGVSVRRPAKKG